MTLPTVALALLLISASFAVGGWDAPKNANPILPGYYADPSAIQHDGKYYIYATLDPWGGKTLGCWESTDFKNWTYRELNWPTKAACTSPTSQGSMVWAPSVIKASDGKFHMFISVGSEVWTGVADHPLGPWKNALGSKPLVDANWDKRYHMIDAEGFVDDDGSAYVYWGSGLNWVNGHCFVAKLNKDLTAFVGEVKDVTPGNYFEGPIMIKEKGKYYLTYSQGRTDQDSYAVHYAVGDSPMGPFAEASNSPILVTDRAKEIISPGHHTFLRQDGKTYIIYHRQSLPFEKGLIRRQVCMDEMVFRNDGLIEKVKPTHEGPEFVRDRFSERTNLAVKATATASSAERAERTADRVLDDNYATRWAPDPKSKGAWLAIDLGQTKKIASQELRMEYAWKDYTFTIEYSNDSATWYPFADFTKAAAHGSPIVIDKPIDARHLRITFPETVAGKDISIWEWAVFGQ